MRLVCRASGPLCWRLFRCPTVRGFSLASFPSLGIPTYVVGPVLPSMLACVCRWGAVGCGKDGGVVVLCFFFCLCLHQQDLYRSLPGLCLQQCSLHRNQPGLSGPDEHAAHTMILGWARETLSLEPVVAEKEVNPSQSPTSTRTWSRTTPSCYTPHRSPAAGGFSASTPPASSLRAPQRSRPTLNEKYGGSS